MRWLILLVLVGVPACSGGSAPRAVGPQRGPTPEPAVVVPDGYADEGIEFGRFGEVKRPDVEATGAAVGSVELIECRWRGDGSWLFRGRVELPTSVDEAQFNVTMGWYNGSDTGPISDYSGVVTATNSGEFVEFIGPQETEMREVWEEPEGTVRDRACLLWVRSSSIPVEREWTYHGPTSAEISGPRPSLAGRLAPGPLDLVPVRADVIGSLTGYVPDTPAQLSYVRDEPIIGETIGPGVLGVDDVEYRLREDVPFVNCGVLGALIYPDLFAGPGASVRQCLVIAGLSPENEIEWLAGFGGATVKWDGDREWKQALTPVMEVRPLDIIEIGDESVVIGSYTKWFTLPLAEGAVFDCDRIDLTIAQPWDLPPSVQAEGVLRISTGEIVKVICTVYRGG